MQLWLARSPPQLAFRLLNSRVVTEYLQSGHLNARKPFIIVTL